MKSLMLFLLTAFPLVNSFDSCKAQKQHIHAIPKYIDLQTICAKFWKGMKSNIKSSMHKRILAPNKVVSFLFKAQEKNATQLSTAKLQPTFHQKLK